MNRIITILCLLAITFAIKAQNKVYSGNFNTAKFSGSATYHYIDRQDVRIFTGPFSFRTNDNSVIISGNFLDDRKSGSWKYEFSNRQESELWGLVKMNTNAQASGNYRDGKLSGNWTLSCKEIRSFNYELYRAVEPYQARRLEAYMAAGGYGKNEFKPITITTMSEANFKDDRFAGAFSYSRQSRNENTTVNGQFNNMGYFDGTWTAKYYENKVLQIETCLYRNGVLLKKTKKDNSTGKISILYEIEIDKPSMQNGDNNELIDINEFFRNYNPSDNISKIGTSFYKLIDDRTTYTHIDEAISVYRSYIYEVERGSDEIAYYPQQKIVFDTELTRQAQLDRERIAEEQLRKEMAEIEERRRKEIEEQQKKAEAERKRKALEDRKNLVYAYKDFNPEIYNSTQIQIISTIKDELSSKYLSGKLDFSVTFKIDTTGGTTYRVNNINPSGYNLSNIALAAVDKVNLNPVYNIYGNTVSAEAKYDFRIKMDNRTFNVKRSNAGMDIYNNPDSLYRTEVSRLIAGGPIGKYKVQIQNNRINDIDFSNNSVLSYRGTGGPSNMFLSLLIPGLGVKPVTGGAERGIASAALTYGLIGAGVGCKIWSNKEYDKYHAATNQTDMDEHYKMADKLNKGFYVLAAAGAAVWVSDIIWVAAKGFGNKKQQRAYKKSLVTVYYEPGVEASGLSYQLSF